MLIEVAGDLGLTVSIPKTKIMACGRLVQPGDEGPIRIDDDNCVESVSEFQYLGSMVERSGRVDTDVERRVMQASRAFGCLRRAVFKDRDLTVRTKRNSTQAVCCRSCCMAQSAGLSSESTRGNLMHFTTGVYEPSLESRRDSNGNSI